MKYLLYNLLMLCVCMYMSLAQTRTAVPKVWERDDFNKPTQNKWSGINSSDSIVSRTQKGGKLVIENKNDGYYIWTTYQCYTNPTKDISTEILYTTLSGTKEANVGFVFTTADTAYYFLVNSTDGTFWMGFNTGDQWKTLNDHDAKSPYTYSDAINKGAKANKLTVSRVGDTIMMSINNHIVQRRAISTYYPAFSSFFSLGIVTFSKQISQIEYFELRQDNESINLPSGIPPLSPKERLSDKINSADQSELCPIVSHDGKTLYFTRRKVVQNTRYDDDVYFSVRHDKTDWEKAQNIGAPINNPSINSLVSVAPDNNSLVLMHQYDRNGNSIGKGLSISNRTASGGWSIPQSIDIDEYYNMGKWNEYALSPDRKVLVCGAQRKDSYGFNDLYVCFLQDDGTFSTPKNMGNVLNTWGMESAPFIAADGKTLYFSSNGHSGYGSHDIFMSRRLDSSWTNWTKPLNLGSSINTPQWDSYFSIAASDDYAYLCSNGGKSEDIFRIKLPKALRPEAVVIISGRVLNSKSKEALSANITYRDLSTNKEIGKAISNPKDGSYKIILPAGRQYSFYAQKEGFYPVSQNIDTRKLHDAKEIQQDLLLAPIEVGQTITMNNIFFDFNKAELRKESEAELDRVYELLNTRTSVNIEVAGHTDNVGDDAYNLKLSQERTNSVKTYLVKKGVKENRITATGYGKAKPVTDNATEAGRQKNRRVEFTILAK